MTISARSEQLRIACITFSSSGNERAKRIKSAIERQPLAWLQRPLALFQSKRFPAARVKIFQHDVSYAQLAAIFQEYDGIVFFCATGTAVRLSAPFFQDTEHEPAIVVVDECGRYAISLTTGGLAADWNLAEMVSEILDSQAIVTTASDSCGIEAIDLFARKYGLLIENLRHAAHITTLMVEGAPIQFVTEIPAAAINYQNLVDEQPDACIYVTSQAQVECALPHCVLRPRNLNVGLSCRGASKDAILHAIMQVFEANNLSINSILTLAVVDSARHEKGLHEAQEALQCELKFFDRSAIKRLQTPAECRRSYDEHGNIANLSICERCVCLAGGDMIVGKTVIEGVGLAVTRQ